MISSVECAKQKIRLYIAHSGVSEDPRHADNTLKWLLYIEADAGDALQLAALAHDVERASGEVKLRREHFDDYDVFKTAHAHKGAEILRSILTSCGVEWDIVNETCRLVAAHEVGGDPRSDVLKDADSISYFDVNLPLYYEREGWTETKRRSRWGYRRLSPRAKEIVKHIRYEEDILMRLLREVIIEGVNR